MHATAIVAATATAAEIATAAATAADAAADAAKAAATATAAATAIVWGPKSRKRAPPKHYQKREQNTSKKEQKLPRVRGEHCLRFWGTLGGS